MKIPFSFNPLGVSKDSGGGMPTSGLVFYAPLSSNSASTASTGQVLTYRITPAENNIGGIDCLQFTGSSSQGIYTLDTTGLPSGKHDLTLSIWVITKTTSAGNRAALTLGINDTGRSSLVGYGDGMFWKYGGWGSDIFAGTAKANEWHHLLQTYSNNEYKCYDNGVLVNTTSYSNLNLGYGGIYIGNIVNGYDYWNGYLAAARIYDRALTDEEIELLASEFIPHYQITAQDLTFSLYQKNETYGISYSSAMAVTFEIIEGSLPNTISFNTSTGQFSGKGLTDADHVYNLKVRLTAPNSDPATCNVTIYTYKTARISLSSQTFSFISNKAESKSINYTSDESVTFTIESGMLPAGMSLSTNGYFSSSGTNTSAETQQVIVRATSANNQTGVTATMTLDMQMNAIVCNAQTFKFYTAQGAKTKTVKYSGSLNTVSDAVFSVTGTLPAGVTFDTATGTFTSDGTQTADETVSVSVTVSSSNGSSTAATATMTLEVHLGEPALPNDMIWYLPFEDSLNEEVNNIAPSVNGNGFYEFTEKDSIPCVKCSSTAYSSEYFDYGETSRTILDIGLR